MWKEYNPNPVGRKTGDCAVRALAKVTDSDWETAYAKLCMSGYAMGDMPDASSVFAACMRRAGFYRKEIPNTCPDCYTAEDFCEDNPEGTFVLGFGSHVAAIEDGCVFDAWDSSKLIPITVWYKEDMPPREGDENDV